MGSQLNRVKCDLRVRAQDPSVGGRETSRRWNAPEHRAQGRRCTSSCHRRHGGREVRRGPWLQGEPTWKARTGEARRRGAPAFGHSGHASHFIWDPRCSSPSCLCGSWDRGRHAELTPHLFLKRPPPTAWANLESVMLSESRQTQKDKLFMIPLIGDA